MNRPTPISVFSDQRRTKSITWSRLSCGAQLPVKVPQDFFLARCAPPSTRPGPRPWSAPSSPRTQSVSASPPPDGGDAPEPERRPLRSRRTPSASGRTPSAASPVPHTGPRPEPCPEGGASEWPPSPLRCNAFVPFSYVRSAILTDERFLHFQLRQDTCRAGDGGVDFRRWDLPAHHSLAVRLVMAHRTVRLSTDDPRHLRHVGRFSVGRQPQTSRPLEPHLVYGMVQRCARRDHGCAVCGQP